MAAREESVPSVCAETREDHEVEREKARSRDLLHVNPEIKITMRIE